MATIVFSTVGQMLAGPVGGFAGTVLGSQVDAMIFGTGGGDREGPRLSDLTVQGSDYGTPLPRHYGVVRSAGTVIWSSGLKETAHRSGNGKTSRGQTTSYSYSASFAVAIAGRRIERVGRIWADGKLLRGTAGDMKAPGTIRVYDGSERQASDPALQAELGIDAAPCHRGTAYVVFEDLELADFANRVPNLSFEIFATGTDIAEIAADLCETVGAEVTTSGLAVPVRGFSASRNSDLGSMIAALNVLSPLTVTSGPGGLSLVERGAGAKVVLSEDETLWIEDAAPATKTQRRIAQASAPCVLTLVSSDPVRDYQPSLQRAFRVAAENRKSRHIDLPATLTSAESKQAAEAHLAETWASRARAQRRVSLSQAVLEPCDRVIIPGDGEWHVQRTELSALGMTLDLERRRSSAPTLPQADSGTAVITNDIPQGETALRVVELPPIGGEPTSAVRLWLATGGASAGWRRAEFWVSSDGGATWKAAGASSTPAKMGLVQSPLPASSPSSWDEQNSIVVELQDEQPLETRSRRSVMEGANLALVGDELIQFIDAQQIAPRRWRLSGLLRGRRATEGAVATHMAAEHFLLIEPEALVPLDVPLDHLGANLLVKAVGPADSLPEARAESLTVAGRSLRPFAPVHIKVSREPPGSLRIGWVRRSRLGFAWVDGVDAPLGEEREAYRLSVKSGGQEHRFVVHENGLIMSADDQNELFGSPVASGSVTIRQLSQLVGPGETASRSFDFS